jgi:hypothetical protein
MDELGIISQPITLSFRKHATSRRCTLDFLVHWSDGRSELIEVEYRTDLRAQSRQLRPAFIALFPYSRYV